MKTITITELANSTEGGKDGGARVISCHSAGQKGARRATAKRKHSLAHLLEELVALEAFVCRHFALGLALLLDDLLDMLLVLVRVSRRVFLGLVLLRLSLLAALVCVLLLLRLHGLLGSVCGLVATVL